MAERTRTLPALLDALEVAQALRDNGVTCADELYEKINDEAKWQEIGHRFNWKSHTSAMVKHAIVKKQGGTWHPLDGIFPLPGDDVTDGDYGAIWSMASDAQTGKVAFGTGTGMLIVHDDKGKEDILFKCKNAVSCLDFILGTPKLLAGVSGNPELRIIDLVTRTNTAFVLTHDYKYQTWLHASPVTTTVADGSSHRYFLSVCDKNPSNMPADMAMFIFRIDEDNYNDITMARKVTYDGRDHVMSAKFHPSGKFIVSGHMGAQLRLVTVDPERGLSEDTQQEKCFLAKTLARPYGAATLTITAIEFAGGDDGGKYLIFTTCGRWTEIWDFESMTCLRVFGGAPKVAGMGIGGGVFSLAVAPDCSFIATAPIHGIVYIWSFETGECLAEKEASGENYSLIVTRDSQVLFAGGANGTVKRYLRTDPTAKEKAEAEATAIRLAHIKSASHKRQKLCTPEEEEEAAAAVEGEQQNQ
jgi:WD40 repeat protein